MTRREAADYIWTYYKVPIVLTLFLLIMVISLISSIVKNSLSDPVLKIGVVNRVDTYCDTVIDSLARETFPEATGYKKATRTAVTPPDDPSNAYGSVQLIAYLAAGEIDVIIADQGTADFLVSYGTSVTPVDISDSKLGQMAAQYQVTPLFYVILPEEVAHGASEKEPAAKRLLEAIQAQ